MNKIASFLLILFTLFVLSSCSKDDNSDILTNTTWVGRGNQLYALEFREDNRATLFSITDSGIKTSVAWTGRYRIEGNTIICSITNLNGYQWSVSYAIETAGKQLRDLSESTPLVRTLTKQ
jgi:hypothetical protein